VAGYRIKSYATLHEGMLGVRAWRIK